MVLYPEVQKRAQEEMDSVLGYGYLPQFGDKDALPYLKAVLHEVLRWNPPAPLGYINALIIPFKSAHESSFQVSRTV